MLTDLNRVHQIGYWFVNKKIPFIPKVVSFLQRFLFPSSDVSVTTKIGKDTVFPHRGVGVVIHKNAIIGDGVKISAHVIIGGVKGHSGVPVIGNNVLLGAGSMILGNIHVGDDAIIGAGAVVTKDVPARTNALPKISKWGLGV